MEYSYNLNLHIQSILEKANQNKSLNNNRNYQIPGGDKVHNSQIQKFMKICSPIINLVKVRMTANIFESNY